MKPAYAERHVRWYERERNESRSENFRFPTYSIFSCKLRIELSAIPEALVIAHHNLNSAGM